MIHDALGLRFGRGIEEALKRLLFDAESYYC